MNPEQSKDKCKRNQDNWKKRALAAESQVRLLRAQNAILESRQARMRPAWLVGEPII